MNSDLVFPNKNEDAFLERAEKLGYQALIFAYEKKEHIPQKRLNHEKIKIFITLKWIYLKNHLK